MKGGSVRQSVEAQVVAHLDYKLRAALLTQQLANATFLREAIQRLLPLLATSSAAAEDDL